MRDVLLADEPDAQWAEEPRVAAAAVVAEARRVAAGAALATGQVGSAAALATEALRHDPYDEQAVRTLMRALAAAGRPATALAEYARFRELLGDELGVEPSAQTRACTSASSAKRTARTGPGGRVEHAGGPRRAAGHPGRGAGGRRGTGRPPHGRAGRREVGADGYAWGTAAAARGVTVLRGRAEEGELALQPVLDALAANLTDLPEDLRPDTDPGGSGSGLPGPRATADALSLRVFAQLDDAVRTLSGPGRVVLLLDDGDETDPVTWAWIAHLRRRREPPILLVVALRDRARAPLDPDLVVEVPALRLEDARELVGDDRAERLWQRSGGNALLLTELARADLGEGDRPSGSLRETVSARLRRTGDAAPTLRTAAVLGAGVDLDLLAAVVGLPPIDVLAHLDTGVGQAFIDERAGTLAFRARPGASGGRGGGRQRAAGLDPPVRDPSARPAPRREPARAGTSRPRGCGDLTLAAASLVEASDLALARLDLAGAERLLDEAIGFDDRAPLRLRRSRVRMSRGDLDGADADAEHAMATDDTGEALELRAWAARNRHDLDGAVRLGRAAAAAATDPTIRASSLIAVAFGHRGNGDLRAAETVLEEAVDAPDELGLPAWPGVLRVHQGRPSEALATLEPHARGRGPPRHPGLLGRAHPPDDGARLRPARAGPPTRCASWTASSGRSSGAAPRCGTPGCSTPTAAGCCATSGTSAPRRWRSRDSSWPARRRSSRSATSTWPTACCARATSRGPRTVSRSRRPSRARGASTTSGDSTSGGACCSPGWPSRGTSPRRRSRPRSPSRPRPTSGATSATPCSAAWSG